MTDDEHPKSTVEIGYAPEEASDSKLTPSDGVADTIMDKETTADDLLLPSSSREASKDSRSRDSKGLRHSSLHRGSRRNRDSKGLSQSDQESKGINTRKISRQKYSKKSERHSSSSRNRRHQSGERQSSRRRSSERPSSAKSSDRRRRSRSKHSNSTRLARVKSLDDIGWESTHGLYNDGRRGTKTDHHLQNLERRTSKGRQTQRRRGRRSRDISDHDRSKRTEAINTLYRDEMDAPKAKMKLPGGTSSKRATTPGAEPIGSRSCGTMNALYGKDYNAKTKAMGAGYERATNPGVEQVDSSKTNRSLHTIYGRSAEDDAKAKAKASMISSEPTRTPGVQQVPSALDGISASSQHSTGSATSTDALYGSAADATNSPIIWQKARLSRGNFLEQKPSPSTRTTKTSRTINTLYGGDVVADTKAKAKASKGSDVPASNPGVETVTLCNSTRTGSMNALYGGSEAESNVKATVSRGYVANNPGAESFAESDRTDRTVGTLYGYDAYANARGARVGSRLLAAFPGVERLRMRSPSASNSPDAPDEHTENEVREPLARQVSTVSTISSESGSFSEPVRKSMMPEAMEGFQMPNDPEVGPEQLGSLKKQAVEDTLAWSRKKRMIIWLLLLLLLLIGAGAAVWYFLFRNNSSTGVKTNIEHKSEPTSSPTGTGFSPNTGPSTLIEDTTFFPSASPSRGLTYQPPSKSDCQAIAANQTIAGRETMENADFELGVEVVLPENKTLTEPLLQVLLDAIQRKILPSLAGCSIIIDELVEAWRFVIFDAFVTGSVPAGEVCTDESLMELNCHRVSVKLNLFLKGAVRFLDIIALISDEGHNIANHLELDDLFSIIKLIGAESLIPTEAPTRMPSATPTFSPTEFPTMLASSDPTGTPSVLPTRAKTGEPSPSPTMLPSEAPSMGPSTMSPTADPSAQPSTAPSESPSVRPTNSFSGYPTVLLTPAPSSRPSETPSAQPSARPSSSPTLAASAAPTVSPAPSTSPSSTPSATPTASPSGSPTSAPSEVPTITTFHWVTCGRNGQCSGPASVQNSNYDKIGGTGSEIGIRCCSDTWLPLFGRYGSSCPYVRSSIGGVCYESATHHEATAICAGVGARLCTQAELEDDCARGSGCGLDWRWVWTSDPGP